MRKTGVRKGRIPATTILGIFALCYLAGVGYFLHLTTHNHDTDNTSEDSGTDGGGIKDMKDGVDVKIRDSADDVALKNGLDFSTFEKVMEYRRARFKKAQNRPPTEGPGEHGEAVKLTPEEQKEADRLFDRETFNVVASDKVAMDRTIRDTRDPAWVVDQYIMKAETLKPVERFSCDLHNYVEYVWFYGIMWFE